MTLLIILLNLTFLYTFLISCQTSRLHRVQERMMERRHAARMDTIKTLFGEK